MCLTAAFLRAIRADKTVAHRDKLALFTVDGSAKSALRLGFGQDNLIAAQFYGNRRFAVQIQKLGQFFGQDNPVHFVQAVDVFVPPRLFDRIDREQKNWLILPNTLPQITKMKAIDFAGGFFVAICYAPMLVTWRRIA